MGNGRKNLKHDLLQGCPQPGEGQKLMRVVALRGSNLIEAEDSGGCKTLCLLPAKFHKLLWVKRGTYVIVDEGDRDKAAAAGMKVTGTISLVLYDKHKRELEKTEFWPAGFASPLVDDAAAEAGQGLEIRVAAGSQDSDEEDDDLPPLELNCNRLQPGNQYVCSDSDTDSDAEKGQ